ncbi:MAG TPA: hypothetical protein VF939_06350 [Puia sp.]
MPVTKKKNIRKSRKKSVLNSPKTVIVTLTDEKETLFPEKLKKVNEMLSNAELMD